MWYYYLKYIPDVLCGLMWFWCPINHQILQRVLKGCSQSMLCSLSLTACQFMEEPGMALQIRESKHPYDNNTNFEVGLCSLTIWIYRWFTRWVIHSTNSQKYFPSPGQGAHPRSHLPVGKIWFPLLHRGRLWWTHHVQQQRFPPGCPQLQWFSSEMVWFWNPWWGQIL